MCAYNMTVFKFSFGLLSLIFFFTLTFESFSACSAVLYEHAPWNWIKDMVLHDAHSRFCLHCTCLTPTPLQSNAISPPSGQHVQLQNEELVFYTCFTFLCMTINIIGIGWEIFDRLQITSLSVSNSCLYLLFADQNWAIIITRNSLE